MKADRQIKIKWLGWFLFLCLLSYGVPSADAQMLPSPTYEVEAEASVKNENYLESKRKATRLGFRRAVESAIEDLLGSAAYSKRMGSFGKILSRSQRYVRNYRYLESLDDSENKVSKVKLEVALYIDALQKKLAAMGALSARAGLRSVIILIKERSVAVNESSRGWDYVPISEMVLGQRFIEEGIKVINRSSVVGLVSDESITQAARGNISAAVDIGFRTGAEIVVVGNAISSLIGNRASAVKTIQANLSLKVISTTKAVVVAAKSDFAITKDTDVINGELDAFEKASDKLSGFILNSILRFWNPQPMASMKQKGAKPSAKVPSKPEPKPHAMARDEL